MENARKLEERYPSHFRDAGERIDRDITRLAQARAIFSSINQPDRFSAFEGTYRGNVAMFLRLTLASEMAASASRLFAPINSRREIAHQDRSLLFAAHCLNNDPELNRLFRRNARRYGASGSYSFLEDGVTRELSFSETLRSRIREARAQEAAVVRETEKASEKVCNFAKSTSYGRVRAFRSERIAHSLPIAADRRKFGIDEAYALTFDDLLDAASEALEIATEAFGAFYRTALAVDDLDRHWSEYAREFWEAAGKLELPNLRFS